jgi:cobalt-zinc-cadmium efflux system membrane fusion protein
MRYPWWTLCIGLLLLMVSGCAGPEQSREEQAAQPQEPVQNAQGEGHSHDEAGGHLHGEEEGLPGGGPSHGAGGEVPAVAVTSWTLLSELFMEYPALVSGVSGRFAIHVTDLSDFSPLNSGEAVLILRDQHGSRTEFRGGLSRPGIFGVDVIPPGRGEYSMNLQVISETLNDLHLLGPVRVHAQGAAIPADAAQEVETISFLKEQQWILDFATEEVDHRRLQSSMVVPAGIEPRAGGEAVLSVPVAGRVGLHSTVPVPGTRVRAGEVIARIIPRSRGIRDAAGLRADLVEAEQQYELARQERERTARLVKARALPGRRLGEAEARETASKARRDAARERMRALDSLGESGLPDADGAWLVVRAPFAGVVAEVQFAAGSSVEEGEPLLRLVDPDRVHVVGSVPESRASNLANLGEAELMVQGQPPLALGAAVAVGGVIDPATRTVQVRYDLDNREQHLPVGSGVRLRLFLGESEDLPAVPESAVVDDGGRPVVFVQTDGESFERRPVRLGSGEGGYVHVIDGVVSGERVVSRGAYLIRLAAMSTQIPTHGHVH